MLEEKPRRTFCKSLGKVLDLVSFEALNAFLKYKISIFIRQVTFPNFASHVPARKAEAEVAKVHEEIWKGILTSKVEISLEFEKT